MAHPIRTDKSTIAEHSTGQGHCVQLYNIFILSTTPRYMDCIVRKATEIELQLYNLNREGGFVSADHGSLFCSLNLPGHDTRSISY
jgi:hypothetical protein